MALIAVNLIGLLLILGVVSWFWLYHTKAVFYSGDEIIDVIVDGGTYTPSIIKVKHQQPTKIRFLRKDPAPCAQWVIFDTLNISQELPVDKKLMITLKNEQKGTFEFTCQMGMYRGKLIVE